jgi:hypothetical protein
MNNMFKLIEKDFFSEQTPDFLKLDTMDLQTSSDN